MKQPMTKLLEKLTISHKLTLDITEKTMSNCQKNMLSVEFEIGHSLMSVTYDTTTITNRYNNCRVYIIYLPTKLWTMVYGKIQCQLIGRRCTWNGP